MSGRPHRAALRRGDEPSPGRDGGDPRADLSSLGTSSRVTPAGRWVLAAVAAVLAAEHTGEPVMPVGPAPEGVVDAVLAHRVTTLLAGHAAELGLDDAEIAALEAARFGDVALGLAMVAHTRAMSEALTAAGVDHLVVKGTALASVVGRGAASRGPGDIDTWVRPEDLGVATEALDGMGWVRSSGSDGLPAVGSGWQWDLVAWVGNELSLSHPRRAVVDLHWRLEPDDGEVRFGFDEALELSEVAAEVGPSVRTLGPAHALAHVSQHARKEHFAIVRQCVDVVDASARCGPQGSATLAERDPNVALALGVVAPLAPWLGSGVEPTRRLRRLVAEVRANVGSTWWRTRSQQAVRGWRRVPVRVSRESWLVRSAPSPTVAMRHLTRTLIPLRLVVDASPVRHRRRTD